MKQKNYCDHYFHLITQQLDNNIQQKEYWDILEVRKKEYSGTSVVFICFEFQRFEYFYQ